MPVVTKHAKKRPANEELKRRLIAEWKEQEAPEPRPDILMEEDDRGAIAHVYVIWSEWGTLDQQSRSEIITDAYWEFSPLKAANLTVAMGVTPVEAKNMRLDEEVEKAKQAAP